jgi:hypothetical protein
MFTWATRQAESQFFLEPVDCASVADQKREPITRAWFSLATQLLTRNPDFDVPRLRYFHDTGTHVRTAESRAASTLFRCPAIEPSTQVPRRAAIGETPGEDFSSVRAYPGRQARLGPLGAPRTTAGDEVAPVSVIPEPGVGVHDLTRPEASAAALGLDRLGAEPASGAMPAADVFDDPKAWSPAGAVVALDAYRRLSASDRRAAVEAAHGSGSLAKVLKALPAVAVGPYGETLMEILRWEEELVTRKAVGRTYERAAEVQAKLTQAKAETPTKTRGATPPKAADVEETRSRRRTDGGPA